MVLTLVEQLEWVDRPMANHLASPQKLGGYLLIEPISETAPSVSIPMYLFS